MNINSGSRLAIKYCAALNELNAQNSGILSWFEGIASAVIIWIDKILFSSLFAGIFTSLKNVDDSD